MEPDLYRSPLASRYASRQMAALFSPQSKHVTWRRLWVALARGQSALGLPITREQISELEANVEAIDFAHVKELEKSLRHDVMAHIHAFGHQCPMAKGILHLGATSCFVTDNGDLIQYAQALDLLEGKLAECLRQLAHFADAHADLACLGFTHLQPAQPTTVGKRACLWLQDFVADLDDLLYRKERLGFLGVKGATGTQASFLDLFDGDHEKVKKLDQLVAREMGFTRILPISGQTYMRKQDVHLLDLLGGIAISAHKCATDLRLLAHLKEIEEPFEGGQVGSSAMPYKRNPVRSERVCALARFVISLGDNPRYTAATQWFERTLDDSANRRLALPEAFLATDALLNVLLSILPGLVIHPKRIARNLEEELPHLAMEVILMAAVKKGGDRQALHEQMRIHSRAAEEGGTLLEKIAHDPKIPLNEEEIALLLRPDRFTGRACHQVKEYLAQEVASMLKRVAKCQYTPSTIEV